MARICLITGAHLCRNPRVVKEASALSEAGHEVAVLGPVFSEALALQDAAILQKAGWRHITTVDLRPDQSPQWQRLWWRALRRVAGEACLRLGWQTPYSLGYGPGRTLKRARHVDADLYIGHQEVGAWAAVQLLQEGYPVGADIEDWYSRDLLPEAQAGRPIGLLETCEETLLRHGTHVTTTSHALASGLSDAFGTPQPRVVYNAFPWSERNRLDGQYTDRTGTDRPSLHWFSQTIGPGRGLDTLCEALREVSPAVDVHLRGNAAPRMKHQLRQAFPAHRDHRLFFHELVPPAQLMSRIAEHDIGLALEQEIPPSRDLTVTNKILQYLLGGLAVVATPTAGQREVASAAPEAVHLCAHDDPASLAMQINTLVASSARLKRAKSVALQAAEKEFCWERQVPVLLDSVEQALLDTTTKYPPA